MSTFNPKDYLIKVQGGRDYLPVAARLIWFRQERPDWTIETEPLHLDIGDGVSVYRATIKDEHGRIRAQATKMETRKDFFDFIEKSETGAIGRALAMCGYGTQFTNEFDEGDRIVDSPQPIQATTRNEAPRVIQTRPAPQQGAKTRRPAPQQAEPLEAVYPDLEPEYIVEGDPFETPEVEPAVRQTAEPQAETLVCANCQRSLTQGQHAYSMRKYQRPLCPSCQKAA